MTLEQIAALLECHADTVDRPGQGADLRALAQDIRDHDRGSDALIAYWCEEQAKNYPAEVFTPGGKTTDGIAGTAIREFLLGSARRLRDSP